MISSKGVGWPKGPVVVTGRHGGDLGKRAGQEGQRRGSAVRLVMDRLVLPGLHCLQQGETVSQQDPTIRSPWLH